MIKSDFHVVHFPQGMSELQHFDLATTVQHQHKRWFTLPLMQSLHVHIKPSSAACTTASSSDNLLALFLYSSLVLHKTSHEH